MAKSVKKAMNKVSKTAVGIGAGVAAAAALGAYFLTGKGGAKNRANVKGWMMKAKKEVVKNVGKLQDVSEAAYHKAVKEVVSRYEGLKDIDANDMKAFMAEAKRHWMSVKRSVKQSAKKVKRAVSKKPARR